MSDEEIVDFEPTPQSSPTKTSLSPENRLPLRFFDPHCIDVPVTLDEAVLANFFIQEFDEHLLLINLNKYHSDELPYEPASSFPSSGVASHCLDSRIFRAGYALILYDPSTPSVYRPADAEPFDSESERYESIILRPAPSPDKVPIVTPADPDPPLPAIKCLIDRERIKTTPYPFGTAMHSDTDARPSFQDPIEIDTPVPLLISEAIRSWGPPSCTFPPYIRWTADNIPNLRDVDAHLTITKIYEHARDKALFMKTFYALFSKPGLAIAFGKLDARLGFPDQPTSPWLCERLPPVRCGIEEEWDDSCLRRLTRYLIHQCQWTYNDITTIIEPYVARRQSEFFWNPCCYPRKKVPAPFLNRHAIDWFNYPSERTEENPIPQIHQDSSFLFPYDVDKKGDRYSWGYITKDFFIPKIDRSLAFRLSSSSTK